MDRKRNTGRRSYAAKLAERGELTNLRAVGEAVAAAMRRGGPAR